MEKQVKVTVKHGDAPEGQSPHNVRPPSPVSTSVSMATDNSQDRGIKFQHGDVMDESSPSHRLRPPSPVPTCVSMATDNSQDRGIKFQHEDVMDESRVQKGKWPLLSSGRNVNHIFETLEEIIITFFKNELKRYKRILSPNYEENFENKEENESDVREEALKMALHFLRSMQEKDLADKLQENELDVLCQSELKRNLKTKYQNVFEGIRKQGSSALLEKIYTEIYITEGGSGKVNEEHEVRQIESLSKRPTGQETPIKCIDIFKTLPNEDKTIRSVVTKGVAGIGKTVSVQKFILDWAKGEENQDIHFIFPLPFRELNLMKDEELSLRDLLQRFFTEIKQLKFLSQRKYKVLFIFDGLDECRLNLGFQKNENLTEMTKVTSLDVLLTNLIKGNLLPSALLWITSRPAAANQIPPEFVDRVTEAQGFSDVQKEEYFRKRISEQNLASTIISHIKSSRSLHIMCHIPVFCWIAVTVLEIIFSSSHVKNVPKTLTEMYTYFLIFQTKQRSLKFEGIHDSDPQWNKKGLLALGKLAYEQLEKGHLIFYEKDLRDSGIDVSEAAVQSGICTQMFREESGIQQRKVYCFVHLSIQEYLAALYVWLKMTKKKDVLSKPKPGIQYLKSILSGPVKVEESVIIVHKNAVDKALEYKDGRFDLFLRFLLGLSVESNENLLHGLLQRGQNRMNASNDETIRYIKDIIRKFPTSERVINLFHCLNELNDHSLVEEVQSYLSLGTLSESKLSPAQWSAVVFVLLTSEEKLDVFDLKKYIRSDEGLIRLLPVVEESQKAMLSNCSLTERSCRGLGSVLRKASSKLKDLDLSGNSIGDVGVEELCSGLKNPNCALETLKLSDCNVTEKGCVSLASALKLNPSHLRELDLRGNDPGGVKVLLDLKKDPKCKLRNIRFLKSAAAEEACAAVISAVGSNPLLRTELDLSKLIPEHLEVSQLSDASIV